MCSLSFRERERVNVRFIQHTLRSLGFMLRSHWKVFGTFLFLCSMIYTFFFSFPPFWFEIETEKNLIMQIIQYISFYTKVTTLEQCVEGRAHLDTRFVCDYTLLPSERRQHSYNNSTKRNLWFRYRYAFKYNKHINILMISNFDIRLTYIIIFKLHLGRYSTIWFFPI